MVEAGAEIIENIMCRIHQRNVDALMACVLPYHGANEFVRLMQLMQIAGTQWAFLQPMQQSGAALPRGILVQRCHNDKVITANWFGHFMTRQNVVPRSCPLDFSALGKDRDRTCAM